MEPQKLNIGDSIKKFRELKNMTREDIADRLGLSVSAYGKIERNETDVTISRIQQIAEVLQVEMSQILNFDVSQIFNISNNHLVQSNIGPKAENMHFHNDEYREKYIKILETENERLRKIAGEI
ncbi:helix-turn-helix domain-containing protein [Soonwooa sp.]|uniref:helix-turn-helix domain-containing protein n=1 Tax=Soonwooa sp. TaxID=1938592 RepID=UPI002639E2C3|nr:helix-turn-helix domain-containing protein [Soonwooa sp.]